MSEKQTDQLERVRDRFTKTADVFSDFVLATRGPEAERLIQMVAPLRTEMAVDFACGPGTMTRSFAGHVRWICGLDFTPAMLVRARKMAHENNLANVAFCCGNAMALPFADRSIDIAVGSYCLHHISDPAAVIHGFARALRQGGRLGILDMVVPEDPVVAELNNRIERVRDSSHERELSVNELERMLTSSGFRVTAIEQRREYREFNRWMHVAGWKRGDAAYEEAWRLLEASLTDAPDDKSGFEPRLVTAEDGTLDMEMSHQQLYMVGEKR